MRFNTRLRAMARGSIRTAALLTVTALGLSVLLSACANEEQAGVDVIAPAGDPNGQKIEIAPLQRGWRGDDLPVPIPGGIQIPEGPFIHLFVPGPLHLGFMGRNVEPSVITDYRGFTAMAYLVGQATDGDGRLYDMLNDIRVYQGEYIAADGTQHEGTFGFI